MPNESLINRPNLILREPTSDLSGVKEVLMSEESRSSATLVEPAELTPEQLVEQCQAGSREAFPLLVELYEKRLFHYLCQLTGNPHDAEDLTQETFLKVYRSLHRFNSGQGFTTWLFTIAKRTAYNHFRSSKKPQEPPTEEPIDSDDPSTLLEQKDEKLSLWKVAKALNPDQYETLWLRYGEGFSIAETADILHTNQIRVRVLLHRARKNLAQRLRGTDLHIP